MTIITVTKSPIRGIDAVTTMEADMVIVLAPGPIHHVSYYLLLNFQPRLMHFLCSDWFIHIS